MPNERAVVARGLASNHQFRRASMAAVETSPIIDKLGSYFVVTANCFPRTLCLQLAHKVCTL
jgi:hypothetical protein